MKIKGGKQKKIEKIVFPILGIVMSISLWVWLSSVLGELRVPNPFACIKLMAETINECQLISFQGAGEAGFLPHIICTLQRYLIGTASGIFLAIAMLVVCTRFPVFLKYFMPIVDILRTIPPLALAPFLLLWFGPSLVSIMGVAIFYTFVTVFVSGVEALQRVNPVYENFARTLGAGKNTVAFEIVFPALFPALVGPIKVAACSSWGLIIIGEQLGAVKGLGRIINAFVSLYDTSLVVVVIFWVLLMALIVEIIIALITGYMTRWMARIE